ncbi:MAG: hypothetical protein GXO77_03435, partial [Calditrichaeota bacterium]|nr:hypothetical protein [Calditrichota bacterium]
MRLMFIIIAVIGLSLISCQTQVSQPSEKIPEAQSSVLFKIDMTNAPQTVTSIKGTLTNITDSISFDFEIKDGYARALVENIPAGTWNLQVDAFDSEGKLLYTGTSTVEVISGKIIPVYLQLNPVTGSIEIIVTWGNKNSGIIAYFPFDDNLKDYSMYHNDAESYGGIHFAEGVRGKAVNFDGIDDFLQIPHLEEYNTDEKTIAFWFYKNNDMIRDTQGRDDVEGLVIKAPNTSLQMDFTFHIGTLTPPFNMN